MSRVTVAEPDETSDPAPGLELSRVQMNVVFGRPSYACSPGT